MRSNSETGDRDLSFAAALASNPSRVSRNSNSNGSAQRRGVRGAGAIHTAATPNSSFSNRNRKSSADNNNNTQSGSRARVASYPRNPDFTNFINELSNHNNAMDAAAESGAAEATSHRQSAAEGDSGNHTPVMPMPMPMSGSGSGAVACYWNGASGGGKRTDGGGGRASARWDGRQVLIGTTVFWSLLAIASLTIAFATDNWIHVVTNQTNSTMISMQQTRSGLWRSCAEPLFIEFTAASGGDAGKANAKGATTPTTRQQQQQQQKQQQQQQLQKRQESETKCTYIWNDIEAECKNDEDSFHSIGHFVCSLVGHGWMHAAMMSPVVAQLVLIVASTLNAMGFCNPKRKFFTLIGGVLLMLAGIFIMIGVVVYIYFVSSELGMKEKKKPEGHNVIYHYDLSFSLTVASFFFCEIDGVLCCYLYSRSFRTLMSMERARRSSSTLSLAAHRVTVTPPAPLSGAMSRASSNPNGFASGAGAGNGNGSGSATNGALVKASSSKSLLIQTDGAAGTSCSNSTMALSAQTQPPACNEHTAGGGGNYLRFNSPTSSSSVAAPVPKQVPSPLFSPVLSRPRGQNALAGGSRRSAHSNTSMHSMHTRAQSTGLLLESVTATAECEPGYCVPATLSESMHLCTCSGAAAVPPPPPPPPPVPFGPQQQCSPTSTAFSMCHSHYAQPHTYSNAGGSIHGHPHGILRPMSSAHALVRHVQMPNAPSSSPIADGDVNPELMAVGYGSNAELEASSTQVISPGSGSGEQEPEQQLLIESPNVLRQVHITYHMPVAGGCGQAHVHGGHVHAAAAQAPQQWRHHRSYYATTGPPPRRSTTLGNFQTATASSAAGTRLCRITQV